MNRNANLNKQSPKSKNNQGNIIQLVKDFILEKYSIRFDIISLKYEWKSIEENDYKEFNENDLFCELLESGYSITKDKLLSIINSSWIKQFNPFEEYFKNLPVWDGITDYIGQISNYLDVEDPEYFKRHFKKWLVRVVACSLKPDYFNKQMLLFVGPQNNGKTSFQRFLCPSPLREYYTEDMIQGKDELIVLTQSILILMDELSKLDKAGVDHVKQLMTKTRVRIRLPYGRFFSTSFSHSSYMGNTNKTEFLRDETGSIRFLCFSIKKIDFAYSNEIDMNLVYAQAYKLYKTGFYYEVTRDEEFEIQEYNRRYQVLTHEQELLLKHFRPGTKDDNSEFLTSAEIASQIAQETRLSINSINIGKGLTFLNFPTDQLRRKDTPYPVKGYWVNRIQNSSNEFNDDKPF